MIRKRVFNAISIKTRQLMDSPAIKLSLLILFCSSAILAFLPGVRSVFLNPEQVRIQLQGLSKQTFSGAFWIFTSDNPDLKVGFDNQTLRYDIIVLSKTGKNSLEDVKRILQAQNLSRLIQNINSDEIELLTNSNITVEDNSGVTTTSNSVFAFFMSIVFVFFLMVLILISRIAAQIAYEKGNQLTEVVLTSLTRDELFMVEIVTALLVILANISIVILPMLVASLIKNQNIVSDYSFLSLGLILAMLIHLTICFFSLMILCVGLSSMAKEPTDSNIFSILLFLPLLASYLYTVFRFDLYKGAAVFLNYVPMVSIFPILGGLLRNEIDSGQLYLYFGANICVLALLLYISRNIFVKNISTT